MKVKLYPTSPDQTELVMEKSQPTNTVNRYTIPAAIIDDCTTLHDAHRIRNLVLQWTAIQKQNSDWFQHIMSHVADDLVDDPEQSTFA